MLEKLGSSLAATTTLVRELDRRAGEDQTERTRLKRLYVNLVSHVSAYQNDLARAIEAFCVDPKEGSWAELTAHVGALASNVRRIIKELEEHEGDFVVAEGATYRELVIGMGDRRRMLDEVKGLGYPPSANDITRLRAIASDYRTLLTNLRQSQDELADYIRPDKSSLPQPKNVATARTDAVELYDGVTDADPQRHSSRNGHTEHLVIIVPGIRDRGGDWGLIRDELMAAGFATAIVTWSDYFGIPRFLVPATWFRRLAMRELEERIWDSVHQHTRDRTPPSVSFIAHSFGSYVLCHLLRRQYLFEVNRIILCGSVLNRQFRFSKFSTRFCGPIINDVGGLDRWPFIASCITFGYGTIGTYGYMNAPVVDRFHRNVDHGGFTDPEFCREWWIPILNNATSKARTPVPNLPTKESTIRKSGNSILQNIKWLALLVILILILHFLPRALPCSWQFAFGFRDVPCTVNVSIQRTSDMSKTGCRGSTRHFHISNHDTLIFTEAPDHYDLQAHLPANTNLKIIDGRGSEIVPAKTTRLLSESGWLRTTQRVHLTGKTLQISYLYEGDTTSNDDDWGFAFVSALPILAISAEAKLPPGKSVAGLNPSKEADNGAFSGCSFDAGSTPRLVCNKSLNNETNVPQYLYWKWNVFDKC